MSEMSQLNTYLNSIKNEKDTKLIPENINKGITILGVPGNSKYTIKTEASKATSTYNGITKFIEEVNNLDLTRYSGTSLLNLFASCIILKKVSFKNSNKIIEMSRVFYNCNELEEIDFRGIDVSNVTIMNSMFDNCFKLSDESLNNILKMCTNAVKISSNNKTLKYIGLTSTQATKCTTLSNYQAFLDAGWTTGY